MQTSRGKQPIYVDLNYAPKTQGKKFEEWCSEWGFTPLGGGKNGRRAWSSGYRTYLRDGLGIAITNGGESFIFYEEDLAPPKQEAEFGLSDA